MTHNITPDNLRIGAITEDDLRLALEDVIARDAAHEDMRDARRAATVLLPEECKRALLKALENCHVKQAQPFDDSHPLHPHHAR